MRDNTMEDPIKADVEECGLKGCNRIGVLEVTMYDHAYNRVDPGKRSGASDETGGFIGGSVYVISDRRFCCKTHVLKHIAKQTMPRYSKKRAQSLAGTLPLKSGTPPPKQGSS